MGLQGNNDQPLFCGLVQDQSDTVSQMTLKDWSRHLSLCLYSPAASLQHHSRVISLHYTYCSLSQRSVSCTTHHHQCYDDDLMAKTGSYSLHPNNSTTASATEECNYCLSLHLHNRDSYIWQWLMVKSAARLIFWLSCKTSCQLYGSASKSGVSLG